MKHFLIFLNNIGFTEWLIIGSAVLLFFGGKKIPELMRGLGRGIREFQDAKNQVKSELESGMETKVKSKPIADNENKEPESIDGGGGRAS